MAFRAPLSRRLVLPFLLGGLVLVGLFLLGGFVLISNPWGKKVAAPSKPIPVEKSRLRAHVLALTQTSQPRNPEHPGGLEEAARYMEGQWKSWGLPVESQYYKAAGQSYRNLMTYVGPAEGPRLIVGAHYDVCGDQPGADDNASAVAGLLELSRLFQQQKPPLPLRVDLVAYTLEEPPFFGTSAMGSTVHARSLVQQKIPVRMMVCLEMIGYYSDKPGSQQFPSPLLSYIYPTTGNFIAIIGRWNWAEWRLARHMKHSMRAVGALPVYSLNSPSSLPGVDFSDHRSFWAQGIPALMITDTAFMRNPHYHEITDKPETLDFAKMAEVVRGLYWALLRFPAK